MAFVDTLGDDNAFFYNIFRCLYKNYCETGTLKRRALKEDNKVTSNTMLILLAGISMAATIGDSVPCTAKERPG